MPTGKSPAKKVASKVPAEAKQPTDHQAPADPPPPQPLPDKWVRGELLGVEIWVLPIAKWRASAVRALKDLDWDGWAAGALHPSDRIIFRDLDPTMQELFMFMEDIGDRLGQTRDESIADMLPKR